ncbi:MAG: SET domain-containing protein, partial [Pseudomonadota bacterium]|nr:SET domain-containing protein [Pseudomonadota bacterium]
FALSCRPVPNKGLGVFADEPIPAGAVVESCPVLVIDSAEADQFAESRSLSDYLWQWENDGLALALGYGSVYNHTDAPNLEEERNYRQKAMVFRASRDIQPGEELTVRYRVVWFTVHP